MGRKDRMEIEANYDKRGMERKKGEDGGGRIWIEGIWWR